MSIRQKTKPTPLSVPQNRQTPPLGVTPLFGFKGTVLLHMVGCGFQGDLSRMG